MAELLKEPVFMVGAERSGTTLLRLMLDHHPEIAFHFEFEFAVSQMGEDGSFPDMETYRQWLGRNWIFRGADHQIDPGLGYPHLVDSFLRQKRDKDGKLRVGATVHHHFDRLLFLWPDARFIHLVRDPRDVARSCIGMGWAGNLWTGLDRWIEAERIWERMKGHLPSERFLEVRLEDLVREPDHHLAKICGIFGKAYHPAMLSYPEHSTYAAPDPSLADQWKNKLTEEEIRLVEARVGEMMTARGYPLSGLPRLEVSARREKALRAQDRRARRRFRIKRFGLPLLILAKLSRHFPFRFAEEYFEEKLLRISRRYIK